METLTAKHFRFADFELDGAKRLLLKQGKPVALNSKTFELLFALVEHHGEVLSKNELLEMVWPGQFVEEGNLTVHVSNLRKVFGERKGEHRFIVTVPGRGYSFVAELNDGYNGEIIVESHRVSRLIVEQTETEHANLDRLPLSWRLFPRTLAIGAALILGGVAATAWIYNSRNQDGNLQASKIKAPERQFVFTTAGGGVPSRVAISPDGKILVYVEQLKGRYSLRLGEIDGSNSVEIVPASDRIYGYLVFAPDGKNIYFTARDSNHRESTLMRVSIFGGAIQELISEVNSSIAFSRDGKSVAFLRRDPDGNRTSIMIADAENGKNERVLTVREKPENTIGGGISWSPDGRLIAFAATDAKENGIALFAANTADGNISKIGETIENRIVNLVWLADGSGLFVNRNSPSVVNDGQIWFVPYPQGEARPITNDTLTYSFSSLSASSDNKLAIVQTRSDPQIRMATDADLQKSQDILEGSRSRAEGTYGLASAPDGKILFTAFVTDSRTIWEMDADGRNQKQLTTSQKGINDAQINVTPDNRFIVFDSNRSGSFEIWRANRDGSDLRALTDGGGNIQPVVSPNGLWVVYISLREGKYELRRVPIDGGEPIQITTEKSFWPAVSPDGRFIAFAYGRSYANPNRVIYIIPFEGGPAVKTFEVPIGAALYNRLRWSPDGQAIVYKDEEQGLWRQDLSKDTPEQLECPDNLRIYHFSYSADGKLVYTGGIRMREIVILENTH